MIIICSDSGNGLLKKLDGDSGSGRFYCFLWLAGYKSFFTFDIVVHRCFRLNL